MNQINTPQTQQSLGGQTGQLAENDLERSGEERRSLRLGDSQFNQHYAELQRAINVSLGRVNPDLLMRKIETKIDGKGGKKYFAEAALEGSSEEGNIMSCFFIQVSNPIVLKNSGSAADLADAIETIFPAETEDSILWWNRIPVRMNYKYDLSVLIDDVLPLLNALVESDTGINEVHWGSSSFQGTWKVTWNREKLKVQAIWGNVAGRYEDLLNGRAELELGRDDFLAEWKTLLCKLRTAIAESGIKIEDDSSVCELAKIDDSIPRLGCLYLP